MGHHHDLVWGPSLPAGGCVEKQTPGLHWPRRQVFSPSGLLSFLCKEKTNDGCTCTVNRHISLSTSCNVRLHKGWWTAARLICYLYSLDGKITIYCLLHVSLSVHICKYKLFVSLQTPSRCCLRRCYWRSARRWRKIEQGKRIQQ